MGDELNGDDLVHNFLERFFAGNFKDNGLDPEEVIWLERECKNLSDMIVETFEERINNPGKVIVITSPSGGGKTTIVSRLINSTYKSQFSLEYGISFTTRSPRVGEVPNISYYFISKTQFISKVRKGDFVEWDESANGNLYGTDRRTIENILSRGKNYITEINTTGAKSIKAIYGDNSLSIFLAPPSLDELKKRLEKRGTESEEKIRERMLKAVEEIDDMEACDYVVVNSDLEKTYTEVVNIINNFLNT